MNRRGKYTNNSPGHFKNAHSQNQPSTSRGNSSGRSRKIAHPEASMKNPKLFNINHFGSKVVTYRNLHPSEHMYDKIMDLISSDSIVVENIVEVNNPILKKAYDLKKAQKRNEFPEVHESLVFHGTKKANVNSICTSNFDWRLYNKHKYGKGVSFSTNAKYASWYSDSDDYHKVMIVAKVLIADVCQGHEDMDYPPPGYDTSQKGDSGIVLVKYEDNEFYPAYKLYYHIEEEQEQGDFSYYSDENDDYYEFNDDHYEYNDDYYEFNDDHYEYNEDDYEDDDSYEYNIFYNYFSY